MVVLLHSPSSLPSTSRRALARERATRRGLRRGHGHGHRQETFKNNNNKKSTSYTTVTTWLLSLLATFLLGTVLVLSIVKSYFGVDWNDVIQIEEVNYYARLKTVPYDYYSDPADKSDQKEKHVNLEEEEEDPEDTDSILPTPEKIPRIIHQTWKTSLLPVRWASLSSACQAMHPDFQYMLWTDASSLSFIQEHYPWFLPTYIGYKFDIQRADAIRYFVLHKYGGVYMDLDIGCRKPLYPLLVGFNTILPVTKPVGISNDLMFSEPNSPFMDSVIHNLMAFDHAYLSDYPTVMFSTGPMFLSAVLSLWNSKSTTMLGGVPSSSLLNGNDNHTSNSMNNSLSAMSSNSQASPSYQEHHSVRILPQSLYGKNIDPDLAPDAFFYHYYGSSWHQGDSFVFTFLGNFGRTLMNLAFVIVLLGTLVAVLRRVRGHRGGGGKRRTRGRGLWTAASNSPGWRWIYRSATSPTATLPLMYDDEEGNYSQPEDLEDGYHSAPLSSSHLYRERSHHRQYHDDNDDRADGSIHRHEDQVEHLQSAHQRSLTAGSSSASAGNGHAVVNQHRQRRRHRRRALAAGARLWLFGYQRKEGAPVGVGNRRRSASTGAIQLPLHSSESSSDERYCNYTYASSSSSSSSSSSEDGKAQHQRTRGAGADGIARASTSVRPGAPSLHRRNSSQKVAQENAVSAPSASLRIDVDAAAVGAGGLSSSRSPLLLNLLDLPPPPPYRPPSPSTSTAPHSRTHSRNGSTSLMGFNTPVPASPAFGNSPYNHNNQAQTHSRRGSWFSSLFSRSPSPAGLISPLPFFTTANNNNATTSSITSSAASPRMSHSHEERRSSDFKETYTPRHLHASLLSSSSASTIAAASQRNSIEDTRGWSEALGEYHQHHQRRQHQDDADNGLDSDVFSLHSVKRARR